LRLGEGFRAPNGCLMFNIWRVLKFDDWGPEVHYFLGVFCWEGIFFLGDQRVLLWQGVKQNPCNFNANLTPIWNWPIEHNRRIDGGSPVAMSWNPLGYRQAGRKKPLQQNLNVFAWQLKCSGMPANARKVRFQHCFCPKAGADNSHCPVYGMVRYASALWCSRDGAVVRPIPGSTHGSKSEAAFLCTSKTQNLKTCSTTATVSSEKSCGARASESIGRRVVALERGGIDSLRSNSRISNLIRFDKMRLYMQECLVWDD
jgi:hypothetical protein